MSNKPTYAELQQRIQELESSELHWNKTEKSFEIALLASENLVEEKTVELKDATRELQQKILEYETSNTALKKSEIRYRVLFDNMSNCVAMYQAIDDGDDFIFIDFNKAAEKAEGIKRHDLIEKSVLKIFPGVKEFGLFDVFQKVWHTGTPIEHPISFYEDDRLVGWRENFVFKLPTGEIVAIYDDVTSKKIAEEELRLQAEIINHMTEGVYLIRMDGTIVYTNPKFEEMFGYKPGEMIGENASIVNYPTEIKPEETAREILAILDEKGVWKGEIQNIKKDGTPFWCYANVIVFDHSRHGKVLVAVHTDITERKEFETQLRQSYKMEALGTLAGGIAHDFNNLLAVIIGYADMARDDIPENNPAKHQIKQVIKAGNRARDLVKHILAFSRKETEGLFPVDVHLIVRQTLKLLRSSLPTTITIEQNIDSHCGNIMADANQVQQILMNLCTNAAHAMEDKGGVLTVDLKPIDLDDRDLTNQPHLQSGSYILLSVNDTGTGIEKALHDRIFDPYFTTKEVGKGFGMGLSVVSGIVKSGNGMITVESSSGEGSNFTVYFPKIEETIKTEHEGPQPLTTCNERILVIDDEEPIADIITKMTERLGYDVTMTTSSTEALKLFRAQPDLFDLVITDYTMPELTGEELAKEFMTIRPSIPIILCTGYSSQINAEKAKSIGICAFIMKPVNKKTLGQTIREVLDSDVSTTHSP